MPGTRLRKFALTAHVVSSVGWAGALTAFLVLAIAGLTAREAGTMRAAYLAMDLTTRFAIVPLAAASLVSGVVQALITPWGLLRHYWVLFKLLLVLAATFTLINETGRIAYLANLAAETTSLPDALRGLRFSILAHSIGGLAVLVWAAALGIYKPRGITPIGVLRQRSNGRPQQVDEHRGDR